MYIIHLFIITPFHPQQLGRFLKRGPIGPAEFPSDAS